MLDQLIRFFNKCEPTELKNSLDELDRKIEEIFRQREAEINDLIVNTIKDRDANFYVWFCFLKANFLRGKDVFSNRAFKRFCNEVRTHDYYYVKFPEQNICPQLNWQHARSIEMVLQSIKERFGSGEKFINEIKEVTEKYDDHLLRYLQLIRFFKEFKGISNKIANAVLNEVSWEMYLLKKYKEHNAVNRLLKERWLHNLFLSSFFNVMIDTHVKNFFEKKLNLKDVDQITLILIGKHIKKEIINELFERQFYWIEKENGKGILEDYAEFVGANLIEKTIWTACFVKKNLRKENYLGLKFFQIGENPFV